MYIDFHTHAFSEKIVERAMSKLILTSPMEPVTDGSVNGLKSIMNKNKIDISVVLPIATKPSQHKVINNWAAEIQCSDSSIVSFGSIHPEGVDALRELERIKALGLHGVKFHPDYQEFFVGDRKHFPIYRKCAELDLPVIFHAGYDPTSPENIHGMPEDFAGINDEIPELTMILAHMGGMYRWDEVERHLLERNIYFDTAVVAGEIGTAQLRRLIEGQGADRILFASDCPWDDPLNEIEMIKGLGLSAEDENNIFYRNAERLLK